MMPNGIDFSFRSRSLCIHSEIGKCLQLAVPAKVSHTLPRGQGWEVTPSLSEERCDPCVKIEAKSG